jgi:iron complex transport system substrate-binding protein
MALGAFLAASSAPIGPARAPEMGARPASRGSEGAMGVSRVVSLSPQATESLFAIGAGAKVVGVTTYCDYPSQALGLPKIGGFSSSTISVEKIVALKPDLVVSAGAIHEKVEAALARFGIPCFQYAPKDFSGVAEGMRALGTLCGAAESADRAAGEFERAIRSVVDKTAAIPRSEKPLVYWEIYDDPLMTCGAATFQAALIEAAGGTHAFADLAGDWPRVSAEAVIARSPDWIMGADDHGDALTAESIARRPGWASLPAVKSGRIALFPAALVSRAGPRLAEGALLIARALHPGLF